MTTPAVTGGALRDDLLRRAGALALGDQRALLRVHELCSSAASTAQGVALEASRDEGFAALLLRVANSAYSASSSGVADVPAAVARLGYRLVGSLAVAAPGMRLLVGSTGEARRHLVDLHRHSVRTAVVARMVAPTEADADRALTAGLVHNLGLTLLALQEPELLAGLREVAARGVPLPGYEEGALGFTHAELGGLLAGRWGYPPALVAVVAEHDAPSPSSPLAALVQVADLLVREFGFGVEPPAAVDPEVAALAGVDVDSARARVASLLEAYNRLEAAPAEGAPPPSPQLQARDEALLLALESIL